MSKKVLVYCPYYPPHVGGLENHADEFNRYLVKHDFEVTVFTPRLPNDILEKELKYGKVKVLRFLAWEIIPNYPLPCFWDKRYWEVRKELSKDKYDWVISRTRFFWTSVMAGIWAKRNKIKWMHVEHGSDFVKLNSLWKSWIAKIVDYTLGKWILKNADKVVANSKATADFCKKLYSKRNYQIIYRGVEIDNIIDNKIIREKYGNKVIILFAGRLIDGKGITDLIKAMKLLNSKEWILIIVGDGPRKKDLEEQTKQLGLEKQIVFWGQLERQKLIGIVNVVDIIVNPSYTEGIPTNVIEAAKCGKAIVATNVGGTEEIIEDKKSGFLILTKRPDLIAEKINLLINDVGLREKIGLAAKRAVENKFNWNESIKKYIELLK